ncbi:hypothetical protein D3C87_2169920 [compost metagenome]
MPVLTGRATPVSGTGSDKKASAPMSLLAGEAWPQAVTGPSAWAAAVARKGATASTSTPCSYL